MARYLIDANLPRYAGVWASGDCEFVLDIDPALKDIDIWRYAGAHGLTLVSKDACQPQRTGRSG
jgi:predicted nuclease of predicted toxin-antitoxin system